MFYGEEQYYLCFFHLTAIKASLFEQNYNEYLKHLSFI